MASDGFGHLAGYGGMGDSSVPNSPDVRRDVASPLVGQQRAQVGQAAARLTAPGAGADPSVTGMGLAGTAGTAGGRRPDRKYAPAAELTILHLSDPQFGQNPAATAGTGLTAADRYRDSFFARLHEDLAKLAGTHGLRPDLIVVTGDLAERGLPSEFGQVNDFLEQLVAAKFHED